MTTIQILLIDQKNAIKPSLESSLTTIESASFNVDFLPAKGAERYLKSSKKLYDVILFGEKLSETMIARLAKMVRAQGSAAHIIMMTRTSGAGLPPRLKKAGIDDMLNVAEINTPVFGWTFLSTLNYADTKKEAEGYVALQKRYNFLCSALKEITWDAAVAVRSMRSALNSMKSVSLPPAAKKSLLGLNSSVNKLNHEIEDLAELRDRLEKETALFKKLLNARAS